MKCDEARDLLANTLGLAQRLALRLHLLRCPACRAEAAQLRTLHAALGDLPRFGPPPELLPTLLAQAQAVAQNVKTRKEIRPMKRLAFVAVFLIVIGLLAGGLLTRHAPPDGRSLLIGVAEAMEQAKTIYVRGHANVSGRYPWGRADEGYYEKWYSPEGFRWEVYSKEGEHQYSLTGNVEKGSTWMYFPDRNLVYVFEVGREALAAYVGYCTNRFLDAQIWFVSDLERDHDVTDWTEIIDGRKAMVVEVDLGTGAGGLHRGTVDYVLDAASGRLISVMQYGPDNYASPLMAAIDALEYDADIPTSVFRFDLPSSVEVREGTYRVQESGEIVFAGGETYAAGGMSSGDTSGLDAEVAWLHQRAGEVMSRAIMGAQPWEDLEQVYLDILDMNPDDFDARSRLGRLYTCWGLHDEALSLLDPDGPGWDRLHYAFCLDALGWREESLAVYEDLLDHYREDLGGLGEWAGLGLNQPTWPSQLTIEPEPGEVRLLATPGWGVSASDTAPHGRPEFAIDNDLFTRWATGGADGSGEGFGQRVGQWFQLEFHTPEVVTGIVFDHQGVGSLWVSDWPRGLDAMVTYDGVNWYRVEVTQPGPLGPATISFDQPQSLLGVSLTLTAPHKWEWWGIHEIFVFGPAR